jgi:hypothetical protein
MNAVQTGDIVIDSALLLDASGRFPVILVRATLATDSDA